MTSPPAAPAWPLRGPRSLLFVPADRAAELLPKALRSGADAVILDLEDGVAPRAKARARETVARIVGDAHAGPPIVVRVNAVDTTWHAADLDVTRHPRIAAIMVPKCVDGRVLLEVGAATDTPPLIPLIESAAGAGAATEICRAPRVIGVGFGPIDFAASLRAGGAAAPALVDHARLRICLAAAAAGIWAVDGPCLDLERSDTLEAEALVARSAGCSGKLVIHPAQLRTVHDAFRPSADDVARARRIVEAYDRMLARGDGVSRLDGLMVDAAVAAAARRMIEGDERVR